MPAPTVIHPRPAAGEPITGLRDLGTRKLHKLRGTEPLLIGRDKNADVYLDDPTVSARHAILTRLGVGSPWTLDPCRGKVVIVNGLRLTEPVELRPGWRIELGAVTLAAYADVLMPVPARSPSSVAVAFHALYGSYRRAARWLGVSYSNVFRLAHRRRARAAAVARTAANAAKEPKQ
jgi:hypothetical protein